jgi:putative FmdB family regulatory protein
MPIYEYECIKCGKKFELLRSMSDSDRNIECPECGADNTRRVFSIFSSASSGGTCAPGGSG